MTLFPHVVAGAAIGSLLPNPVLAAVGGFGSHILLDYIPHWEPGLRSAGPTRKLIYTLIILAEIVACLIFLWLFRFYPNIVIGGLVGGLVEIDHFLPFLEKLRIKTHLDNSGWHGRASFPWGVLTQALVVVISIFVIIARLFVL